MEPEQIILGKIAFVIVGENHNPSILNPDFLLHNGIVSEELSAFAELASSISTPAFSQVAYKSGLQVISEPNKISFTEDVSQEADIASPGMAMRYLEVVHLVHYTAVGVNLTAYLDGGERVLSPTGLLKDAPWLQFESASPEAEVKLVYKLGGRIVNLTIKTENASAPDGMKKVIVFHGNFHRNIRAGQQESHMVANSIVGKWKTDAKNFRHLVENIAKGMKQ